MPPVVIGLNTPIEFKDKELILAPLNVKFADVRRAA